MGKDNKYYKSAGKTVKIKCRVEHCQKVMLRQRYRNHLVECHPGENSRDLREYEHRSMSINKYLGSGNARSKENTLRESRDGERELPDAGEHGGEQQLEADEENQMELESRTELENQIELENLMEEGVAGEEGVVGEIGVAVGQELEGMDREKKAGTMGENLGSNISPALKQQIEDLARRVTDVDISDCSNSEESASKQLHAVKAFVDVGREVKQLEDLTKSLKIACGIKEEVKGGEGKNVVDLIKGARSLEEITQKVPIFEYQEFKDGGEVVCAVCSTSFKYSNGLMSDFTQEKRLGLEFANLMGSLRRHVETKRHEKAEKELKHQELLKTKEDGRNSAIGQRLGRLVYYLVKNGRPDQDYTTLVQINGVNGCDMGEMNHSHNFVSKFLPSLAEAVKGRWRKVLSSPMVATGCR